MKKLKVFLSMFLVFAAVAVNAQDITVTGVVTDGSNNEGVPYATVQLKGTLTGVSTDENGNYSFAVPANSSLIISCVGYGTQTIDVNGQAVVNVVLTPDNLLDETIVVAYGTATKSSFTGSASTVNSDVISKKIATSVTSALDGTTPGVQLITTSGDPTGNSSKIYIRGVGSMSASSQPLYIVDGAPYEGSIANINPNDVESLTVLKDAASSAIYGHRGANGVVIITTKKGKAGDAQVKFDAKWGSNSRLIPQYDVISDPAQYYETHFKLMYNNYIKGGYTEDQAYATACANIYDKNNGGLGYRVYDYPEGQELIGRNFKLNPNATLGWSDGTYYYTPDNWYNETFHDSFRQEYNVSISGANDRFSYYAAGGFLDDGGIVNNSNYKRYNLRVNADYQAKSWLKVLTNLNYTYADSQQPSYDDTTYGSSGSVFYITNTIGPIYPLYVRSADGKIIIDQTGRKTYDANQTNQARPSIVGNAVRDNEINIVRNKRDVIQGKAGLVLTPVKGLSLNANVSLYASNLRDSELSSKYGSSSGTDGLAFVEHDRNFSVNQQYLAEYKNLFGKNDIDVLVGYEQYDLTMSTLYGRNDHLFNPDIPELSNAVGPGDSRITKSYNNYYSTRGILARAQYNYDQRYFASASYRRDASSRFAKGHQWGNFWSLGASWLINNEQFMANVDWVNMLKLKASYGVQGNDNLGTSSYYYYAYADQYNAAYNKDTDEYSTSLVYKGNPDITWETSKSFNVGVDFEFFKGYLNGTIEYFNRTTTDLLYLKDVPVSSGNPTGVFPMNVGSILNQGFDLSLDGLIINRKNVKWNWNANFSHYKNTILALDVDVPEKGIISGYRVYKVGGSLYEGYMRKYAGVNPETGAARYYYEKAIVDGDGKPVTIDGKPQYVTEITETFSDATQYQVGSVMPKLYGGFGTSLTAYGVDFSIQFSYQLGGRYYDGSYQAMMLTQSNAGSVYHKDLLNAWTPENTNTNVPILDGDYSVGQVAVDRFLVSSNYLSINNVTLGYTFPRKWTEKIKVSALRIYFAGENLAVFSARKGVDPRYSMGIGSFSGGSGLNTGAYSSVRNLTGGISLSF